MEYDLDRFQVPLPALVTTCSIELLTIAGPIAYDLLLSAHTMTKDPIVYPLDSALCILDGPCQ